MTEQRDKARDLERFFYCGDIEFAKRNIGISSYSFGGNYESKSYARPLVGGALEQEEE